MSDQLMACGADGEWPDLGEASFVCCYGSSIKGPEYCTCWTAEYDADQQPIQETEPTVRERMCGDCAFLPQSPERQGAFGYDNNGTDDLNELVALGKRFFCHDGMSRVVRYRHPSGAVIEANPGDYQPAQADGCAYKADGSPAFLCAGWAARHETGRLLPS
jgi:hypothetical protein